MGNLFSREVEKRPTLYDSSYLSPERSKKRKREYADGTPSTMQSKTAVSDAKRQEKGSAIDATPDGHVHRHIVTCSTIFWCTRKDIIKLLTKIEGMPPYGGLHKITKWDHFFITFPNEVCEKRGVEYLSRNEYRGELWTVREVTEHSSKRVRIDETVALSQRAMNTVRKGVCLSAADVTAKWRNVPYEEQITRKKRKWSLSLQRVTKNLRKEVRQNGRIPWLDDLHKTWKGKGSPECCAITDVLIADEEDERMYYRNKNEFTVGMSPDCCGLDHDYHKSELTIGYVLGLVRDGHVFTSALDESCVTTERNAIKLANCLTSVMRSLNMPVYDKRTHKGYWRQITCRKGYRTGEMIISVVVNPFDSDENEIQRIEMRDADRICQRVIIESITKHFSGNKIGIFWQSSNHMSTSAIDVPASHLYGIEALHEEMCGLRFRIQPSAFFQVNTLMAERMYNLIGELADVDKNTVVFDVCCGTGTIGLSLAHRAHSVVGIEMNESAIEDAIHNAKLNNIQNAKFIVDKVERGIYDAIKEIDGKKDCVVILDPPRAGLPMSVVAAVRGMRSVRKVVYVACEPNNFWKNALGFLRPRSKVFRLEPFRPVRACGVDLFPHTDHGELVVLMERDSVQTQRPT